MKQRHLVIALTSLLLGCLFDLFFYGQMLGLNVAVFTVCLLSVTFGLAVRYKRTITTDVNGLAAAAVFFACMTMLRTAGFLLFINVSLVFYLLILVAYLLWISPTSIKTFSIQNYIRSFSLVPAALSALRSVSVSAVTNHPEPKAKKQNVTPLIRGILLSLPILAVFLLLFSSADPIFKNYVTTLFDFHLSPQLISHAVIIIFVSSMILGVYALLFTTSSSQTKSAQYKKEPLVIGNTESYVILGSVAFLFLLFLLVQVTYLFGGAHNVLSGTLTYAQYARKGFFELVAVAAIALVLIRLIDSRTRRKTVHEKVIFIWLSGLLIVEVFIVIASALKRLSLYEDAYGFTESRLYGHLFIFWLAAAFLLLFLHILQEGKASQFALRIFIAGVLFLAAISIINPEGLIARQNIQRFASSGKIDSLYLSNLSDDATPAIASYLDDTNPKVAKQAEWILAAQRQRHANDWRNFRSFNISQHRAQVIFEDTKDKLNRYPYDRW